MPRLLEPAEIPSAPNLHFEARLWAEDSTAVAGLDEAGRGAWAGPVVAGAVILPASLDSLAMLPGVRDSKQMSARERAFWAEKIRQVAVAWAVGLATSQEIDQVGIVPATRIAMGRALNRLAVAPQHLLVDALRLPDISIPQISLIKGDARSLSVAAASVLAKTVRDRIMEQMDEHYPGYGFARHKGYGTAHHWDTLQTCGPCPVHRFCFVPVKQISDLQSSGAD